ncbi:RNA deprotection pyrophosphohydrolase [Bacillus benzoevorans]|uniref:8-oxo-dGTP diphosphatase n=1 Tax=Bacillus benzoevorans TaxID=1456 RepID=A0A7X0HRZ0_9BACI|nr:nucleoside triphosphatase YtkD [Bacillus benzoevorans]MBB6445800.1 8-oxo-dGTP diphosphatase [Bacillus benzoevorans]
MEVFQDHNGGQVKISSTRDSFSQAAKHVLVICRFYGQWLLTKHKTRGWEFPGGKKEAGETLEQAAVREIEEETGAQVKSLQWIGEYEVTHTEGTFVKAIFFAEVDALLPKNNYFETNGPVLINGDILSLRWQEQFSFIMKDQVVEQAVTQIMEVCKAGKNGN